MRLVVSPRQEELHRPGEGFYWWTAARDEDNQSRLQEDADTNDLYMPVLVDGELIERTVEHATQGLEAG